ncbi:NADH(P)-binding-domain-containing protein [Gilbertella persicaria]|uniref:NADH(P)-binding-domain-containing protein n=1 Tax=Gilbertella persicaria TaxID=101096 RepID=UPI00221E38BC|nr:NADH(P)-binding-domain-containing protein [Gilbertella persicaria]KAI8086920.1 NADH(P)-binding-domain-containing protein [Gilbertella persicaria]
MVRVAVFGGSKGCSRAMVVQGLEKNQHQFKLLIRNPDTMEFTEEQKSKLTIVKGDALDPVTVRQTVQDTDVIVFSVGSAFDMKTRKMVSPGLCYDSMKVLLDVLKEMDQRPKRLVVVSTTGLDGMKEVPYLFWPMYRYLLHDPHMDKAKMEELVDYQDVISDWIIWANTEPKLGFQDTQSADKMLAISY